MRPTKSINNMTAKISKDERKAREIAEKQVQAMGTSKPEPVISMNEAELAIFEKYANLNDSFNEFDSTSLSLLVKSLYRYNEIDQAIEELDVLDDRRAGLIRQASIFEKSIQQHSAALSIPLTSRLRMANDMAKIAIGEKQLEQMNNQQPQEVNPLLALLYDDDDE
ncbi:hypothetical protein [Priestia megaterium]|uniref:hypothetical protein n=1 Tax=Priestia megaterium TaxID=1404 RepID=UPI003C2CE838